MHVKEEVLDEKGRIDPLKLDAVARMGGDSYLRMSADTIFAVPKPSEKLGIGFDQMPAHILNSKILTGNDLGRLASVESLPGAAEIAAIKQDSDVDKALSAGGDAPHKLAQQFLRLGKTADAWKILLASA